MKLKTVKKEESNPKLLYAISEEVVKELSIYMQYKRDCSTILNLITDYLNFEGYSKLADFFHNKACAEAILEKQIRGYFGKNNVPIEYTDDIIIDNHFNNVEHVFDIYKDLCSESLSALLNSVKIIILKEDWITQAFISKYIIGKQSNLYLLADKLLEVAKEDGSWIDKSERIMSIDENYY